MRDDILSPAECEQFIRDGYVVASGLIPSDVAEAARQGLMDMLGINPHDPATWEGKALTSDPAALALTEPCRTEGVEAVAEQLAGPDFVPGLCFSPYLEAQSIPDPVVRGYIPVLNFPTPGSAEFVLPKGYHIDGMGHTTLWPDKHYLIVFAYLSDVDEHGGATTVLPGSHRQVFEHWVRTGHPGSTHPPELRYAAPMPLPGRAGDVIFMHYLTVHSGSTNRSDRIRVGLNTAIMPDPAKPYQRKDGPPRPDWTPLDWTLRTDVMKASTAWKSS